MYCSKRACPLSCVAGGTSGTSHSNCSTVRPAIAQMTTTAKWACTYLCSGARHPHRYTDATTWYVEVKKKKELPTTWASMGQHCELRVYFQLTKNLNAKLNVRKFFHRMHDHALRDQTVLAVFRGSCSTMTPCFRMATALGSLLLSSSGLSCSCSPTVVSKYLCRRGARERCCLRCAQGR